jgi:hypothetical protein
VLSALAFAQCALCVVLSVPEATSTSDARVQNAISTGWSPKPTGNPRAYDLGSEFRKRSLAYSDTCGWVSSSGTSSALTCFFGSCALYTNSGVGMVGCCSSGYSSMDWQSCGWAATCYDFIAISQSSKCGAACQINGFVRACTDPASPYCISWTCKLSLLNGTTKAWLTRSPRSGYGHPGLRLR